MRQAPAPQKKSPRRTPALRIEPEKKLWIFTSAIATEICPVMEYVEIFLERMVLCRKAAQTLGLQFELIINGTRLL